VQRLHGIAINALIVVGSTLLCLAFFELVVFRTILPASDSPLLDFVNGLVRYAPNQQGIWRFREEIAAPYRINQQGWNSGIGDYTRQRTPGHTRIAVIGDSFIEAFQVPSTASMAEQLGRELDETGRRSEVYRFAISGAPLSQYVNMAEREVAIYRPDWIIVNITHNDFDESYRFAPNRYTSYFLKFRIENSKIIGDLQPTPWRETITESLRRTATVRFFFHRWMLRPEALINLLLVRRASAQSSSTPDLASVLAARNDVIAVARHAAARLSTMSEGIGARLLLVMDGDRQAIYANQESPALELNRIMAAAAEQHGIGFIDLHPIFAAHWRQHRSRLNFETDWHWNELGHSVVAHAVAEHIRKAQ
jgi:lysophospholipase L1-like esterase